MTSKQPSTAEWLSTFEQDLLAVGFTEHRIDTLLAITLEQVLRDEPLVLGDH